MKRYNTETRVEGGYYLNTTSWEITAVDGKAGTLTGPKNTRAVRLPTLMMVIAALLLSFVFIVFLPAAGFVLFAGVVLAFLFKEARRAGLALAHLFAPQWRPGEAWLTRSGKKPAPEEKHEELEEVRKEVNERRPEEEPPIKPA